jgi:ATP-dependent protease ClpP protease subunit
MESHIYIYGAIGQGGVTAERVKDELARVTSNSLTVHISSQGGEVYEGYTIYNLLKNSGKKINVVIEGFCASIATLIALVGNDSPTMYETASFMIHNPFAGVEGDANQLRKTAEHLDAIKAELIKVYGEKTGLSNRELWDMMDKETYFTAKEAETAGFAKLSTESFRAVAYFDVTKINTKQMTENKNLVDDIKKELSGFKNMIMKLVKPKNLELKLQDGTMVYIEAEADIIGAAIYKVDETGAMLPLEDGSYTLEDGRTIVVKAGFVESSEEPIEDKSGDIELLKNEVARLTSELEAKNAETVTLQNEIETKDLALVDLTEKIENVLSKLPAGSTKVTPKAAFKAIPAKGKVELEEAPLSGWAKNIIAEKTA